MVAVETKSFPRVETFFECLHVKYHSTVCSIILKRIMNNKNTMTEGFFSNIFFFIQNILVRLKFCDYFFFVAMDMIPDSTTFIPKLSPVLYKKTKTYDHMILLK
jgi:hypothetical protein